MVDPPAQTQDRVATPPAHHQVYLDRKYFPELDGLRAISVLIVISVHMHDKVWGWLAGHLGVAIFFVLSGYLITRLALTEERETGSLNKQAFFIRRSFRLFPVYFCVLGIYCLLIFGVRTSPEKISPFRQALPFYLVYLQEWPFILGVDGSHMNIPFYQTWTLGIEEKFYFVWPFLAFVCWRRRPALRRWGTAGLILLLGSSVGIMGLPTGAFFFSYSQILIGCLVAFLLDDASIYDSIHRNMTGNLKLSLILVLLVTLHFVEPLVPETWVPLHHLAYAVAAAVAMVALIFNDGPLHRVLNWRPLLLVGRLSYGMYLVHLLCLNLVEKVARPGTGSMLVSAAALVLTWVISAGVAWLLAMTIERPCIAAGRRLSRSILDRAHAGRLAYRGK